MQDRVRGRGHVQRIYVVVERQPVRKLTYMAPGAFAEVEKCGRAPKIEPVFTHNARLSPPFPAHATGGMHGAPRQLRAATRARPFAPFEPFLAPSEPVPARFPRSLAGCTARRGSCAPPPSPHWGRQRPRGHQGPTGATIV